MVNTILHITEDVGVLNKSDVAFTETLKTGSTLSILIVLLSQASRAK